MFIIDAKIFEKYPGVNIGAVIAKGIDNSGGSPEIENILREQEEAVKSKFTLETLAQEPKINAWRETYRVFGVKKNKYTSSVENLARMVLEGKILRHINKLVDIYNFISLKYTLPVGGEDLDNVQGDLVLDFATASEPAVQLLGEQETKPPKEGEVIYKDEISAVCRRWNWREADRTKLTESTKNAILVLEGLPPATKEEVEMATKELAELIKKFCGGEVRHEVLNGGQKEVLIY